MKSTTIIAGLTATVSGAAITRRAATGLDGPFLAISLHSGNPAVHQRQINAVNGFFKLSLPPTTSCPLQDQSACPPGNTTVFAYSPSQTQVGLEVAVNSGQFVYINSNGALAYTAAHAGSIHNGSVSQGFTYTPPTEQGRVGALSFEGETAKGPAKGFVACPGAQGSGPYTIYAAYEGIFPECIGIVFGTAPTGKDDPAAYQYDV